MNIEKTENNPQLIFEITGKIDSLTAPEFEKYLTENISSFQKQIILDCTHLDYISSAGLRVLLINAKKANEENMKILLKNMNETVKEIIDITGFTPLFSFENK
ncbi:MAG: STAS domain-containing protein [Weeksellaceae bacterium]|nr:STAS domain-containing protein [Weeksellaceae bacterium]